MNFINAIPEFNVVANTLQEVREGNIADIEVTILTLNKYASGDFTGNTRATPEQWAAIGLNGGEKELHEMHTRAQEVKFVAAVAAPQVMVT